MKDVKGVRRSKEMTMLEKVECCYSHELCGFITEHRDELTQECVDRILQKAISADMIFIVRRLRKYGFLKKEHMSLILKKCPFGHHAELEQMKLN